MLKCPICNSSAMNEKGKIRGFILLECPGCHYITTLLPEVVDESLYGPDYFRRWGMSRNEGDNPTVKKIKRKTARHLLKKVEQYTPEGKLLDVGCAYGHFLEVALDRGWEAYGVEISKQAASCARGKFKERVYVGSFLDVTLPDNFFDAIIMSDVIEHFPDPCHAIEKAWHLLTLGGVMAIVTPNSQSLSAHLMGSRWPHLSPPEHINYFSPQSIKIALKKHRFELLKVGPSPKWVNLTYLHAQFTTHGHVLFTTMFEFLIKFLPLSVKELGFPLLMGDMLVIARKGI